MVGHPERAEEATPAALVAGSGLSLPVAARIGRVSAIGRQKIVWNGEILEIPFAVGHGTAGAVLALLRSHEPELGLFTMGGIQLAADEVLPGDGEELTLRPVYVH